MTTTDPTPGSKPLDTDRAHHHPLSWRWLAVYTVAVLLAVGITIGVLLLLTNIGQRKHEADRFVQWVAPLSETTIDPAVWGQNFPRQYDGYKRTVDTERTNHGGSEAFQRLDEFPRWKTIFAGYGFSLDYREDRGHAYMLQDQRETDRVTKIPQPGACLHCHASNVAAYRQVGLELGAPGTAEDPLDSENGRAQLMEGFGAVCAMPYEEATAKVEHPVSCLDCHAPDTLALRITKPAFFEGIAALAASDEPMPHLPSIGRWREGDRKEPYDPNRLASRQEMRSMVCAQCHVEYYFKGEEKRLTYPWANGLNAEEMEAYYNEAGFKDWTHKVSGAGVLKAQHPEFELWSQGIHAAAGVACADCHMPYRREGALKFSDHQVRSPLLSVDRACQVCHVVPETELLARAERIQGRTRALMDRAEIAVVELIEALGSATEEGGDDASLAPARQLHRAAQWRLDFVAAENSMGFHADQEAARLLAEAIDLAHRGRLELLKPAPTVIAESVPVQQP